MSVIVDKYSDHASATMGDCLVCRGRLRYPILQWNERLAICGECCVGIKKGFTADLIQVAAIVELNDLGYRDHTFVRKNKKQLEREAARRRADEEEIMRVLGLAREAKKETVS
jgi:hypothetical protein